MTNDYLVCANDPDFSQQWGLYNRSYANIDINVCDAWEITEGDGINVAVLDTGIELTHIDLVANISSVSYDTNFNTSPSKIYNAHGTRVAGIIGAVKDNNIQVVGVAPQSTLFSISNKLDGTANGRMRLANGINWAWQHGADVINNSWISSIQSDAIDDAINNALTKGREGKGTVVVFATGNSGISIQYPANSNPDIISVGSSMYYGKRDHFSNYGAELDVVAPGNSIISTSLNNSTYTGVGTSFAAAHVSGIAALILSVNPCLTAQQVSDIIEKTTQKIRAEDTYSYTNHSGRPNGTWNILVGYGLVNAYGAVQLAQQTEMPLDLYIKDFSSDLGSELDKVEGKPWRSPDIWVRNNADGIQQHQNPIYRSKQFQHYVYTRVLNKKLYYLPLANEQLILILVKGWRRIEVAKELGWYFI